MNSPEEIATWRKAERTRLVEGRMALSSAEREAATTRIAEHLEALIGEPAGVVISAYWPFRGEPDLKPLLKRFQAAGAITALPMVVKKHHPLAFRAWKSGDRLERGVWNIPFPAEGREVIPDVTIAPVVGFDSSCFRLGYGGGFFDRTIAALPSMPRFFGVGYSIQEIPTIHPQRHDIPMYAVCTEAGIVRPACRCSRSS